MASMKTLAKDTAIYGLSSIIGRFLNYLLTPLYTYKLTAASGGFGVITNVYAYTALLLVILTYGMETAFFRFANKDGEDPKKVFSTALWSVFTTSVVFVALVLGFIGPVSDFMGYPDHPFFIWSMAIVVALDAFQSIMFAYLRYSKRPLRFAFLKLLFIFLNIGLNLLFFVALPWLFARSPELVGKIYDPAVGIGYAFGINLFCTSSITFFFWKEIRCMRDGFDFSLLKRMLNYAWPILLLGIAGSLNQSADKIIFPKVYLGADGNAQLGIYAAGFKIAMIMAMITQAFRYAYEPFVFGSSREKEADQKETYSKGMKYFIIFTLLAYLCVVGYMDILRYIVNKDYWDGLKVVPIVMAGELMMGIYFNLSFWYKLIDKTIWGAVFSGIGCLVLIAINVLLIPKFGYMACAWGGVAGYGISMLLSYFVGQKYYPIDYKIRDIGIYALLAAVIFAAMTFVNGRLSMIPALLANTVLIAGFAAFIVRKDFMEVVDKLRHRP